MLNNYDKIKALMSFDSDDDYYFLQILKRRKDNPDMDKDMVVIDEAFFYSMKDFDYKLPNIIKTCDVHNARAYFRINKRSLKKTGLQMLKRVTDLIISENYKGIRRAYSSVSGEFHGDKDKKWIIDFDYLDPQKPRDWKDIILIEDVKKLAKKLQEETDREPMILEIPSKNGVHIITRPFNLKEFKDNFPNMDVHKDNLCILYCP